MWSHFQAEVMMSRIKCCRRVLWISYFLFRNYAFLAILLSQLSVVWRELFAFSCLVIFLLHNNCCRSLDRRVKKRLRCSQVAPKVNFRWSRAIQFMIMKFSILTSKVCIVAYPFQIRGTGCDAVAPWGLSLELLCPACEVYVSNDHTCGMRSLKAILVPLWFGTCNLG